MKCRHLQAFTFLLLTTSGSLCPAQNFSYDGNRWYEIEVTIFSNVGQESSSGSKELVIPEKIDLSYPESITQLVPASSSFSVPFAIPEDTATAPGAETLPAPDMIGPENKPAESTFRLHDFSRDPYIALGAEQAEFLEYNLDIIRSPDHRLLFHAVWRQPVMNRVQSTAIFVSGGNQYGIHHELEGSLQFSYNVNRVDVEARLWLMNFAGFLPGAAGQWRVPAPPFTREQDPASAALPYVITDLSYLHQVRPMISNELHYLDHPDLGMLVQVRPYQLPEPVSFSFE